MSSGAQRKPFGLSLRSGAGGLQGTAARWITPLLAGTASGNSRRPHPGSGPLITLSPAAHPPGASSMTQRWSVTSCLYALMLAACFTTALTAFHGLQTIAPTHGPVGDTWQSAMEQLGLSTNPAATMAGEKSPATGRARHDPPPPPPPPNASPQRCYQFCDSQHLLELHATLPSF